MNNFILQQIESFGDKKYDLKSMIKDAEKTIDQYDLFIVEIKSNKIYADISNDFLSRKKNMVLILSETLDRYNVDDTILLLNIRDGYYWKSDLPVFSFAVPEGKQGLIFPNFDICSFHLLNSNYDKVKESFKQYHPYKIKSDIYFKGGPTSKRKTKIRERNSRETFPFNINISTNNSEPIYKIKEHKYLLDLPGVKPWSVRLKYLFLSERIVIRVSLYNPEIEETGYLRQSFDYIFEENIDYIHLVYKVNYDENMPENLNLQIKEDIIKTYKYFEKNEDKYYEMVNNMNSKAKKISNDETYEYLYKLITSYTKRIVI